ncbi:MAG: VWA domain-containing protein, partial [Chloroflexi bacterium]|nr:VWA domain-containing protein [Chloroflexota bacterium]
MRNVKPVFRVLHTRRRLALTVIMALMLAVGGTQILPTQAQDPPPQPVSIEITSEARNGDPASGSPVHVDGRDRFVVYITLEGGLCPAVERDTPVDVVLVIDISGSMRDSTPEGISKLEATKHAALTFVSRFNLVPGMTQADQIAVVSFSDDATLESDLTRDQAALETIISGLRESGGTNIAAGIEMATDILAGPQANYAAGAKPVIVVLSDGQDSSPGEVRDEADRARQLVDAQIVTVGLGDPDDVDQDTLRDIADSPDLAFFTSSAEELNDFYDHIALLVQPKTVATDLTITYTVNNQYFQIVPDTSEPQAALLGPASAPDTLQWQHTSLNNGEQITFRAELRG